MESKWGVNTELPGSRFEGQKRNQEGREKMDEGREKKNEELRIKN